METVNEARTRGENFATLTNYLGWHVTWVILLDRREPNPVAYETFVQDRDGGIFGRMAIPSPVAAAIPRCGVAFRSTIPNSVWEKLRTTANDDEAHIDF